MGTGIKRGLRLFLTVVLLTGMFQNPIYASETKESAVETGITVTTKDQFLTAIANKNSPIIVSGRVTVDNGEDTDGRMLPVIIPENTVIIGASTDSGLDCRSPIQLGGDNVTFMNMYLKFSSSNALNSVPHREIFLAGHSLTLDNVDTYLEGSGGSLGGFGGTEEELLPTIYAGGYPQTEVGSNASVTIQNSNSNTIIQGIYMGHGTENDTMTAYSGAAEVHIDTDAVIRDGIHTIGNSVASVNMTGSGTARTVEFYGDEHTTLTIEQSEVLSAVLQNVGHLVLDNEANLAPTTSTFQNVTVKNGAALDLDALKSALITGDFTGGTEDTKGYLILETEGALTIQGTVNGITQFQTGHRMFPGELYAGRKYITAKRANETDINFVLADANTEYGYTLEYINGGWTAVCNEVIIGSIEVTAPTKINLNRIMYKTDGSALDSAGACTIIWKDEQGNAYDKQTVKDNVLYAEDYIIGIKTEYWASNDLKILEKTDWGNAVRFQSTEDESDTYYLVASEGAKTGKYTFLFCSDYYEEEPITVADVKALSSTIKKEVCIEFCDTDPEPEQDPDPEPNPNPTPTPNPTPEHTHQYAATIMKRATCTEKGEKTYHCICGASYKQEIPLEAHQKTTERKQATAYKDGSVTEKCKSCQKVFRETKIYRPKTIKLSASSYTYNGSAKKPQVTVKDSKGVVISRSHYKVSYKNNKYVGKATVTIEFTGNYSGTQKKTFTIIPKGTSLSKLSAKSKGITIKWEKQKTQTTGYLLQYSTDKSFSNKTTKTLTIKKNKTTSANIKKLKAKKKYYVRICTYKNIKENGKTTKLCSKWSKVKTIKIKR